MMTHLRIKLLVAAAVMIAALSYLAVAGVKSGWVYHMPVDEFLAKGEHLAQRVRLAGLVGHDNLTANPGLLTARFELQGAAKSVPVSYHGVVPDLFKAGVEVVVEGKLDTAGVFQADLMLTKCASKYEGKDPVPGHGQAHLPAAAPHSGGAQETQP